MSRRIQVAGAAVLRQVARAVRPHERQQLSPLLEHMSHIVSERNGRGIAAPQLGESVRAFVLSQLDGKPYAVLNPRVLRQSRERCVDWESCFSVPDYAALVERPSRVDVEYESISGKVVRRVLDGDEARAFQHELDHLDGVLYTAHMLPGSLAHESVVAHGSKAESMRTSIEVECGVG